MKKRTRAKSFVACALAVCTLAAVSIPAAAATVDDLEGNSGYDLTSNVLTVKYNGESVSFPDAKPYIDDNGRTLIPVRFVAETMGADVSWVTANDTAVIEQDGITIKVPIGEDAISVTKDGATTSVKMDTAAVNRYNRTYVPIRFVAESLGAWVGFSDKYATVQIYKDELTPEEIDRLHGYYDMTVEEWYESRGKSSGSSTNESYARNYPMTTYCDGSRFGFENANEAKLRNPNGIDTLTVAGKQPTTYKGEVSGSIFTFGTQPDVEFSELILNEAKKGVESYFDAQGKVDVSLRSDLSCVYWSRHGTEAATYVRGVLTVTIPQNAELSYISQNYDFISDPVAGETRNVDVEIRVNTFTDNVYWSEMTALK